MNLELMKLGKGPAVFDTRRLQVKDFLERATAPISLSWYGSMVSFGAMLNDTLGNCTCAAPGHGIQIATLNTPDGLVTPPDAAILDLYEKSCGYNPSDPSTDQGGIIPNVLNYIRQNMLAGHKLWAYADPNVGDIEHIKESIVEFGMVDIGLQLPISAQSQVGTLWDVTSGSDAEPGSWGGHSVIVCAYDANGLTCITWGALQRMSWAFWLKYCDEAHALLLRAWMERFGAASKINLAKMESALSALAA